MRESTKKYHIATWGCQMNVHDSEKMAGILEADGFSPTADPREADVVIFNTCSIRRKAEEKFLSELGKMRVLKRINPSLKVAVAGCVAQQRGRDLIERAPYVDLVVGPQNLHVLRGLEGRAPRMVATGENDLLAETELPVSRKEGVRAWVTIMYGCNNYCSYCVVPYTRGRERSRPSAQIVNEVSVLVGQGYPEVTLLGQNVNSYNSDMDFPRLLRAVGTVEGISRVRFVTSHPKDLSPDLIEVMADTESVCEHIHLPLQSGSSRVLGLMNRGYTYEEYAEKVALLRNRIPNISITSDIIAGFPEETPEDHAATVRALREIGFDGVFAFKFSPRPGTAAATMTGGLPESVKGGRLAEILAVQDEMTERNNKSLENTVQEVLIEGPAESRDGQLSGRTRTNKIVNVPRTDRIVAGSLVAVTILRANRHSLFGVPNL
ncbi:MAG: tRNA (N6-isopentenyl adenosine(37)-C2)-methylthiotransferase MiaB [Chloroflexota bacterium]